MKLFRILAGLIALALLLAGGLALEGLRLPETHKEVLVLNLKAPRDKVWTVITDDEAMPQWWDAVKSVEHGHTAKGQPLLWLRDAHDQRTGYVTKSQDRPSKLVWEMYDPDGDAWWGGTWTCKLETLKGKQSGTKLTITEDGFIRNTLVRSLMTHVFGMRRNLEGFGKALQAKLGQK